MVPARIIPSVHRPPIAWFSALAFLALALLLHIVVGGSLGTDWGNLGAALMAGPRGDSTWTTVLWEIRLPRALACILVGGILGSSGAAFQLLFRNALAEPFVVGVSGGSAVLGTLVVSAGLTGLALELGTVVAGCIGGVAALGFVLALGSKRRGFHSEGILIAGAVTSTLLLSLMTIVLLVKGQDSSSVVRWMLGSVTPMFWSRVALLAIALVGGGGVLLTECRRLNALSLGELTARSLGVDPQRCSRRVLLSGSIMTGVAVGASGVIGFLGIIAPNIARRTVGPDARLTVPLSAGIGAGLLLIADLAAQRLVPGTELPVGAVTAVLGAPALFLVLKRAR